mgnify:CR=1 FL=1
MGWFEKFRVQRAKRRIRKLPKAERGLARFRLAAPMLCSDNIEAFLQQR